MCRQPNTISPGPAMNHSRIVVHASCTPSGRANHPRRTNPMITPTLSRHAVAAATGLTPPTVTT